MRTTALMVLLTIQANHLMITLDNLFLFDYCHYLCMPNLAYTYPPEALSTVL
jgi:hypothetical protein